MMLETANKLQTNLSTGKSKFESDQKEVLKGIFRSGLILTKHSDTVSSLESSKTQLQISKEDLTVHHEKAKSRVRLPQDSLIQSYCHMINSS